MHISYCIDSTKRSTQLMHISYEVVSALIASLVKTFKITMPTSQLSRSTSITVLWLESVHNTL